MGDRTICEGKWVEKRPPSEPTMGSKSIFSKQEVPVSFLLLQGSWGRKRIDSLLSLSLSFYPFKSPKSTIIVLQGSSGRKRIYSIFKYISPSVYNSVFPLEGITKKTCTLSPYHMKEDSER
eukprot:TRINITY_DN1404_c0_g1_i1.p1 TRINITY_DN1404_c0_g1~~TRINITY_DN1404_c0_g1_i1.p1  ORF type:complete len:121 (-),score=4.92 TRINITY_DN1404_c0_g1_i1:539-901(-)